MSDLPRPISIAIAAMGGQGGGVLADWIIALAEKADYYAQSTSVPGVAQRTGATVYYLEIFPRGGSSNGRAPIMALAPVAGDVDVVIAGELVEAGRAAMRGFVTPDRTTLIASSHRDYSLLERMHMGDGRVDSQALTEATERSAKRFVAFDMAALAEESGSVISAVLFGALAGSGVLPFERPAYEEAIRAGGVGVKASLAGFEAGYARAKSGAGSRGAPVPSPVTAAPATAVHPRVQHLLDRVATKFRAPSHEVLRHALRRLVDYQDPAWAGEFLDMLAPIQQLDSDTARNNELTSETARHLALWMSYEDTIRVAELKTRNTRIERVRREVRAGPDQIMHVVEFMHPRLQEICDTLPAPLGRLVLNNRLLSGMIGWFCRSGRQIRTSSLPGFLLLYLVSSMKPLRRSTLRHGRELTEIARWLALVGETAASDYALAVELAKCQSLVKGYGDTHERGLGNFHRILDTLPRLRGRTDAAARLRGLRQSALADDTGKTLTEDLQKVA
jgi:indolepyruvate ferredoxin oxidoreductase beta subunit